MNQYQKNLAPFLNKNKENNVNRNIAIVLLITLTISAIYFIIN